MHSLVNAPVLGFDLARATHGARLAAVLRRCLALDPADLEILAAGHDVDAARADAWREVSLATTTSTPGVGRLLTATGHVLAGGAGSAALDVLSTSPLGSLDTLLWCVRHDVLDWTWKRSGQVAVQADLGRAATAVVCDAVAAAALAGSISESASRRLTGPWLEAVTYLPASADDVGPCSENVGALLAAASVLDEGALNRLLAAAAPDPGVRGRWAEAMHAASWGVYLAGRVRPAATAQLLLVEAVHAAGAPPQALALGAWRVLSGAVQAAVVQDVLDDITALWLLGDCRRALHVVS